MTPEDVEKLSDAELLELIEHGERCKEEQARRAEQQAIDELNEIDLGSEVKP